MPAQANGNDSEGTIWSKILRVNYMYLTWPRRGVYLHLLYHKFATAALSYHYPTSLVAWNQQTVYIVNIFLCFFEIKKISL